MVVLITLSVIVVFIVVHDWIWGPKYIEALPTQCPPHKWSYDTKDNMFCTKCKLQFKKE